MSSDESVEDAGPTPDDAEGVPHPTGEVFLAQPPHSALVGLMAEPLSRAVPVRRSTVLMLVAFLGLGALTVLYPPAPRTVTTITTNNPNGFIPGLLATTTTTTHPAATTTTTAPPVSTTTQATATTTTTLGGAGSSTTSTSTSRPAGSTTTAPTGSSTTTTRVGSTTTSTTTSATAAG